jgi:O-antigen ligase
VNGIRRHVRDAWSASEDQMRKQWPVWVIALSLYAMAGMTLLTKVRIPSPLHLIVFLMATAVLSVTALRIEWGILTLALIMPFARPGITIGSLRIFHISGFNFALIGVSLAYALRYVVDEKFASLGPFLRKTRLDRNLMIFGFLIVISSLWSFDLNSFARVRMTTAVDLKEMVLYFLWFYLLVTMLRTPRDLRQFAACFAVGGLAASLFGMSTRLMGGEKAITAGTMETNLEEGAGGRVEGGWLGLGHPNMFAALLLMTMPIWFFAVSHIKRGIRRLVAEVAVINGFLGILFTYSRSAWLGSALGVGLVGLADRQSLKRIVLFVLVFTVAAQMIVMLTINMNLIDIVANRFKQLQESTFSARPDIYRSAFQVVKEHPWLGVGLGAFVVHAPPIALGWVPKHPHSVLLAYASEAGVPCAIAFAVLMLRILWMAFMNLKRIGRIKGYGFISLGVCGALLGLYAQMMVVQIFYNRILGYGFYALAALTVATDRMIREGQFDELEKTDPAERSKGSAWIG